MKKRFRKRFRKNTKGKKLIKSVVKKVLHDQVENKFTEVVQTAVNIFSNSGTGGNGTFFLLNGLQQGTAHNQRIGNRTRLMNIKCSGRLIGPPGASADNTVFRVIVFRWKTCNAATPIVSQVLSNLIASNANAPWALYNPNYVHREIDIIYDSQRISSLEGAPANNATTRPTKNVFKFRRSLRQVLCNYNNGNNGTAADITMNSVWLYATCDQLVANQGTIDFVSTIEYEDA